MSSVPAHKPRFLLANSLSLPLKPIALRCSYAPSPFYTNELCHSKSRLRIEYGVTKYDQIQVYGNNTYTYDDDGYLQAKVTPDETTSYTYGAPGELRGVTTPTQTITYEHNANNQRVAKLIDGVVVEKYLWSDLTTLLAIYDKDDNLIQRFEYADQRVPTSMTSNGTKYYLHYDQVGSLRAVSDTSGNIIKEITYDTYGNIISESNPTFKVSFGFAGGLYDTDTKLTRFGYRDYDAYTGKWTAKDPIDFAGGDTNLYGYVLGDPVNFVDVEGLEGNNSSPSASCGDIILGIATSPVTGATVVTTASEHADELIDGAKAILDIREYEKQRKACEDALGKDACSGTLY